MNIGPRLRRLERAASVGDRPALCATCGHAPGDKSMLRVRVLMGLEGEPRYTEPQYCPTCGRQTVFVVEFDRGFG